MSIDIKKTVFRITLFFFVFPWGGERITTWNDRKNEWIPDKKLSFILLHLFFSVPEGEIPEGMSAWFFSVFFSFLFFFFLAWSFFFVLSFSHPLSLSYFALSGPSPPALRSNLTISNESSPYVSASSWTQWCDEFSVLWNLKITVSSIPRVYWNLCIILFFETLLIIITSFYFRPPLIFGWKWPKIRGAELGEGGQKLKGPEIKGSKVLF